MAILPWIFSLCRVCLLQQWISWHVILSRDCSTAYVIWYCDRSAGWLNTGSLTSVPAFQGWGLGQLMRYPNSACIHSSTMAVAMSAWLQSLHHRLSSRSESHSKGQWPGSSVSRPKWFLNLSVTRGRQEADQSHRTLSSRENHWSLLLTLVHNGVACAASHSGRSRTQDSRVMLRLWFAVCSMCLTTLTGILFQLDTADMDRFVPWRDAVYSCAFSFFPLLVKFCSYFHSRSSRYA